MHHAIITAVSFVFVIACSPAPAPVAVSMRDPSNPSAPEGTTPAVAAAAAPSSSAHDHHHHEATPAASTYVCPMHPEVTSTAPGVCPKCNMKLVPKK